MFWDLASPCSQAGHSSSSTPVCASQCWSYICALSATAEFLWLLFAVYHFQVATNPIITSLTLCNRLCLRYTENYDNRKQNNSSTLKKRKNRYMNCQVGSAGKGAFHQARWPEFDAQEPPGRSREVLTSDPLAPMWASWHTHLHTIIKWKCNDFEWLKKIDTTAENKAQGPGASFFNHSSSTVQTFRAGVSSLPFLATQPGETETGNEGWAYMECVSLLLVPH